jgi:hypothetical protein
MTMQQNDYEATPQQLNQAARLAASRNMDFTDALNAVMQDPNAASILERGGANPEIGAMLEVFTRGQLAGRQSLEFEQRQAAYQKRLEDVETLSLETAQRAEQLQRGTVGLATGFSDHLRQHAEVQAGQRQQFDVERTAALVLEGMSAAGMTEQEQAKYLNSLTDLPKPKAKALLEQNKAKTTGKRTDKGTPEEECDSE